MPDNMKMKKITSNHPYIWEELLKEEERKRDPLGLTMPSLTGSETEDATEITPSANDRQIEDCVIIIDL